MSKFLRHKTIVAGFILALMLGWGGSLAAQTTAIGFKLSGASIIEKDTFVVALSADSILTGRSVFAYRFYISYSPTYFEFIGVDGITGLLSDWGTPVMNSSNDGVLIMAGAGTEALAGSGEMIYLKFRSKRPGNAYISFNTSESNLNEGNPSSIYTNAYISAAARSYPNIYPDYASMFIGDEVQMNVSGGQEPYVYSTDDPGVAQITDVSRVRATGPGTTKILVTDGNGEVSTSTGLFDVRAIRMDIEELSVWPADTFYIPVKLELAPGTTVYSGRFDLAHSTGLAGLEMDIVAGDFSVLIEKHVKSGRMIVSFASTSGITGNGVLCYLSFRANYSGNQYIRFENMRFNETLLAWTAKSTYYINVKSLPVLSISPNSGTLMWGDILKINVYNGTAPYTWSVSNPSLASIDLQGNLTTITGGEVRVTATDANGATKTSGLFIITDHHVSIYSTDGTLDAETRVPLLTSSLPSGKVIFGYKAGISFNDTDLDFIRAEAVSGGGLIESTQSGNTVEVAGALSEGVSSGIVGFLVFQIKSNLALDASTTVSLNSFSANENSLYSTLENGTVHRVEQTSYRPVANAGLNFSMEEGSTGQLDGRASFDLDNDPLTYRWRAPEGLVLNDSTSATPGFIAPYVSESTVFTISLIVNDGQDDSDPSEVNLTVLQVNLKPEADAGADLNFVEGSSVSLDGSKSFDPDGDAISFTWSSLDGIILFNAASVSPSLILPQVAANTSYRFTLLVNDGSLSSSRDTVTITAIQVNKRPVAFAGGDFSIDEKEEWTLDGSLSFDADNDPLSYLWTPPPGISLSSNSIAKPTFTAPSVLRDSVLIFELLVNDGSRDSDPDFVQATIINLDSLSMETLIENVAMTELDSFSIDTTLANVTLYVSYGLDTRSLAPDLILSRGASVFPASAGSHDFSLPVYYNVTAEDGVTVRMWKVEVFRPEKIVERTLISGWNWVSLNVQPPDMDINTLFSSLTLSDLDYLKSPEYSSVYYAATGWFGNLGVFPHNRMVKFNKSIAEDLLIEGLEINPSITPVPLAVGWNDIAYLLKSNAHIDLAIETSSIPQGDVLLKGSASSALYYAGTGWVGDLDSLKVLHGYKMNVQSSGNLLYNPSGAARKSISTATYSHKHLLQEYQLSPENFEHSATLIAGISSEDGKQFIDESTLIIAYHGDEVRGIASARYIPPLDKYLFILTYFSNEEEELISFNIKLLSDDIEYSTDLMLNFRPDDITGEAYSPHELVANDLVLKLRDINSIRISIFPNPVSDHLTLTSSIPVEEIRVYDMTGKKVLGGIRADHKIRISMQDFAPGIYTLEAVTDEEVIVRKIIKTSY